jgi:hypothetical protein
MLALDIQVTMIRCYLLTVSKSKLDESAGSRGFKEYSTVHIDFVHQQPQGLTPQNPTLLGVAAGQLGSQGTYHKGTLGE